MNQDTWEELEEIRGEIVSSIDKLPLDPESDKAETVYNAQMVILGVISDLQVEQVTS